MVAVVAIPYPACGQGHRHAHEQIAVAASSKSGFENVIDVGFPSTVTFRVPATPILTPRLLVSIVYNSHFLSYVVTFLAGM